MLIVSLVWYMVWDTTQSKCSPAPPVLEKITAGSFSLYIIHAMAIPLARDPLELREQRFGVITRMSVIKRN
jgi:hypothetical protein